MIDITLTDGAVGTASVNALVVFTRAESGSAVLLGEEALPEAAASQVTAALTAVRAKGDLGETITLTAVPDVAAPLVLAAGVGDRPAEQVPPETWRRAAGNAARALRAHESVAIAVPVAEADVIGAVAEGAGLGAYHFTTHLSATGRERRERTVAGPVSIALHTTSDGAADEEVGAAFGRARVLVARQSLARDLVNTAPNELYPASFTERVATLAADLPDVGVEVLDEQALAEGGFGGILGVGQGSARPPRMVTVSYSPRGASRTAALVGKGITFDSGGLSLKPATSMITMKCDMGGAAAVVAAVFAAADLQLGVAVTGYLCLAENMPGGGAQRPGDVVTMRDGTTVEIINTDAEGRLVLADGLALAAEAGPDVIVDVATLTGAAMVALGGRTAAIMANDDGLQAELAAAGADAGESVWPMPIAEEIRKGMDSDVADLKHTGEKLGGAMVAAAFLREFVPGRPAAQSSEPAGTAPDEADAHIPWGHLDIAGPAYNEGPAYGYTPKGGTGYGVRTLVSYLESLE